MRIFAYLMGILAMLGSLILFFSGGINVIPGQIAFLTAMICLIGGGILERMEPRQTPEALEAKRNQGKTMEEIMREKQLASFAER